MARVVDMQLLYLVGLIVMIATGERRARLGDLLAGTKIVSAEAEASGDAPEAAPQPTTEVAAVEVAAVEAVAEDPVVGLESPSLQELAADVAASAGTAPDEEEPAAEAPEPRGDEPDDGEPLAAEAPAPQVAAEAPDEDDEVKVKPVETISAIDLVMEDSSKQS